MPLVDMAVPNRGGDPNPAGVGLLPNTGPPPNEDPAEETIFTL